MSQVLRVPKIWVLIIYISRGAKVCCFSDGHEECYYDFYPYWHLPLPECPATFELQMLLYTRDNPANGTIINKQNVPYVSKIKSLSNTKATPLITDI